MSKDKLDLINKQLYDYYKSELSNLDIRYLIVIFSVRPSSIYDGMFNLDSGTTEELESRLSELQNKELIELDDEKPYHNTIEITQKGVEFLTRWNNENT